MARQSTMRRQKLVRVALPLVVLVGGMYAVVKGPIGNPLKAAKAISSASSFMSCLQKRDFATAVTILDSVNRTRIHDRPQAVEETMPQIDWYSFRGVWIDRPYGRYVVRFAVKTPRPERMIVVLAEEEGRFLVRYTDPPGL